MPLEHEINKKEAELLLKEHEIINRVKYLENDKIVYIKYYLGNMKMNKQKMTIEDLALIVNNLTLEMRAGFKTVNDRLDRVEKDIIELKIKVNNIEKCPTIQEELNYMKNNKSNEPTMKEMIKQLVKDMSDIKKCPTIQQELKLI